MTSKHSVKFSDFLDLIKLAFCSPGVLEVKNELKTEIGRIKADNFMHVLSIKVGESVVNSYIEQIRRKYEAISQLKEMENEQKEAQRKVIEIEQRRKALEKEVFGTSSHSQPLNRSAKAQPAMVSSSTIRNTGNDRSYTKNGETVQSWKGSSGKMGRPPKEYDEEGKEIVREPVRKKTRPALFDAEGNEVKRGPGRQKRVVNNEGLLVEQQLFDRDGNLVTTKKKPSKLTSTATYRQQQQTNPIIVGKILSNEPKYHTPNPMKGIQSAFNVDVLPQGPTVKEWTIEDVEKDNLNAGRVPVDELPHVKQKHSAQSFISAITTYDEPMVEPDVISQNKIEAPQKFVIINNQKRKESDFLKGIRAEYECDGENEEMSDKDRERGDIEETNEFIISDKPFSPVTYITL